MKNTTPKTQTFFLISHLRITKLPPEGKCNIGSIDGGIREGEDEEKERKGEEKKERREKRRLGGSHRRYAFPVVTTRPSGNR
jgi:hypothetical protein